jgi:hypothetical protein
MPTTHDLKLAVARAQGELGSEHDTIRGLVVRLRAPLSVRETVDLLGELHAKLQEHFAHEEHPGGFYEQLGACTPAHGEDLRVLVDQHFVILSAVQALKERLRASDRGATRDVGVDAELGALADRIASHERREHELADRCTR